MLIFCDFLVLIRRAGDSEAVAGLQRFREGRWSYHPQCNLRKQELACLRYQQQRHRFRHCARSAIGGVSLCKSSGKEPVVKFKYAAYNTISPTQHLSLSDNKVGHVAAAALARGISSSRFITRLELARCSIGDKGSRVSL